jgi:hypothetical protein
MKEEEEKKKKEVPVEWRWNGEAATVSSLPVTASWVGLDELSMDKARHKAVLIHSWTVGAVMTKSRLPPCRTHNRRRCRPQLASFGRQTEVSMLIAFILGGLTERPLLQSAT